MEIIKRRELFKYLEERLENDYYVGLHGISDIPDIQNQYANMSKLEKYEEITSMIPHINFMHIYVRLQLYLYDLFS